MTYNTKVLIAAVLFGIFIWFSPVFVSLAFEVDATLALNKLTSYEYIHKNYEILIMCFIYSGLFYWNFRKK